MGLFGEAAARLLRRGWGSVQQLAEEINSIFNSTNIDLSPASITINQPAGATIPPITINQPEGTGVAPIQVVRGDTIINLGGTGPGGPGGGGGGINLGDIQWPGQEPDDEDEAVPPSAMNPIALHGRVVGKEGGNTYSVRCWARNPNRYPPIGVLSVQFPDVSTAETIPNGTRCPVIMFPEERLGVIQPEFSIGYVPVFLEPED